MEMQTKSVVNEGELQALLGECMNHNVFPIFLPHHQDGPKKVADKLGALLDSTQNKLAELSESALTHLNNTLRESFWLATISDSSGGNLRDIAMACVVARLDQVMPRLKGTLEPFPTESRVLQEFPELRGSFDKDGLLLLDERFTLHDGGIQYGEHLIHYHQLLRRGYLSNPNFMFLGRFATSYRASSERNTHRIAIDHRRLMYYGDYERVIEADTWYGKAFDENALDDLNVVGVTVLTRAIPSPFSSMNSLTRTEFIWKKNEAEHIKSLEVEEVVDGTKPIENLVVNRYVHAQRDTRRKTFTHFDGACRIYNEASYAARLNVQLPHQPRACNYIKLFRIDDDVSFEDFSELCSLFYKGNELIVEYFDPPTYRTVFEPRIREHQERVLARSS